MWKLVHGKLVQTTDHSRVKFRTNISKAILDQLHDIAQENDTYVNYLLETGLEHVLAADVITFNKQLRPKDRIQYKTTYDKELLEEVKNFAAKNNLFINDVIEFSVDYIDIKKSKDRSYKNRTEI
ncbi:rRNA methyltransferase [Aquibacillus salsiterrae]|uniref:rRNA methyltransferase n=1 Tax=Aquibacillus salsiterrae TaxID=2950439 RepID=A0A9X3WCA6_9BACI|nr:rRNA methyltransferase [Aquibacillus salsiterrae]MDC3416218.1 rRNA methyltransferase [Aquibacillus salsiterrae]